MDQFSKSILKSMFGPKSVATRTGPRWQLVPKVPKGGGAELGRAFLRLPKSKTQWLSAQRDGCVSFIINVNIYYYLGSINIIIKTYEIIIDYQY